MRTSLVHLATITMLKPVRNVLQLWFPAKERTWLRKTVFHRDTKLNLKPF